MQIKQRLTPEAAHLVRYNPEIINLLTSRIGEALDLKAIYGGRLPSTRITKIRVMSAGELAGYLETELSSGVPTDFYSWLMEEVP